MSTINGSNGHVEREPDPFREAVEVALKNRATYEQLAMLEADREMHLLVLGELKRDVESQFAIKDADLAEDRARCLALGPNGREQWARCERDYQSWKAGAIRFKRTVEDAIARLKFEMRRASAQQRDMRLIDLEKRVEALEATR